MFTQPSVNQIASTYQGNPAPLARKVDQDKKQNGGIPKDLRQLMALNDIAQGKNAAGVDQALQIPTNMATVAQNTQQLAQQALQARMLQQAREQQRLQQKPPTLPDGTPQPKDQPQGIDSLETNVGTQYAAEGGIIGNTQHFQSKGSVQDPEVKKEEEATSDVGDFFRSIVKAISSGREKSQALDTLASQRFAAAPGPLEALTPTQRAAREKQLAELNAQRDQVSEKGEITPTYPKAGTPTFKTYAADSRPNAAEEALAAENSKLFNLAATPSAPAVAPTNVGAPKPSTGQKTQGNTRVNVDTAPMPAGLQGLASSLATPGLDYQRKMLNQNENDLAAAKRALYEKEVGARDLSIYDRTAAELEARKQKLNAPKAGYDAMMEYLEQVALGGGRTSAESGSIGASRQRQLQLAREGKQNELMDKILELGAKKSDAQYAEKKGMFELTQAEKERVIKEKTEAAKQLGLSEDKTRELIEQGLQKELDRKNDLRKAGIMASSANRDDLMNRALQIKAENPTISIEDAIKRASIATYAGQLSAAEGKNDAATEKIVAGIRAAAAKKVYGMRKESPIYQSVMETMERDIADARNKSGGVGLPNALPSAGGPASTKERREADSIIAGVR